MTALAAGAILTAGLGAYKAIDGANQKAAAKRLADSNTFTPETIPGQVKTATNLAAQNYYNGMPGAAQAAANIRQSGANQFYNGSQAASSGGDLLDLAAKINQGQNVATNDLATRTAQYKQNALGDYQNALNNEGQWQDKLYQNNTLQPYLRTANTAASLYGAGAQNEFSGLDQISTGALGYASARANSDSDVNSDGTVKTMGQRYNRPALPDARYTTAGYTPDNLAAAMALASTKKGVY